MLSTRVSLLGVACVACGIGPGLGIRANGHPNRTLTASLGQTVELSFQSIGPGEYDTPPAITGASIRFVKMVPADVYVPAGVTQIYRGSSDRRRCVVLAG